MARLTSTNALRTAVPGFTGELQRQTTGLSDADKGVVATRLAQALHQDGGIAVVPGEPYFKVKVYSIGQSFDELPASSRCL
jgi:hypothetical protein